MNVLFLSPQQRRSSRGDQQYIWPASELPSIFTEFHDDKIGKTHHNKPEARL